MLLPSRAITATDAWFDISDEGVRLLFATDQGWAPDEFTAPAAWGGTLTFRRIGDIKGRRIYEAMATGPVPDAGHPSSIPSLLISGPFERGA